MKTAVSNVKSETIKKTVVTAFTEKGARILTAVVERGVISSIVADMDITAYINAYRPELIEFLNLVETAVDETR